MIENIIIWGILTLVPLIPTTLLFKLFQSSASFQNVKKGIKLGGAVAAYFILVGFAFSSWHFLQPNYIDKSEEVKQSLVGIWDCQYNIKDIDKSELGTMYVVQDDNNNIVLHGIDEKGNTWQAGNILLNKNKMIFIFNSTLSGYIGFTWVNFVYIDNNIDKFFGNWVVISNENVKGTLSCSRNIV